MKTKLILIHIFSLGSLGICAQDDVSHYTTYSSLNEFELISLCHCHEYLMLRNYDYIKWTSEAHKQRSLDVDKQILFDQYKSSGQFRLNYQEEYDSSLFFSEGISVLADNTSLDFGRLDSLYFEPLVKQYVEEEKKSNPVPYLGLRNNNFFWDCFYTVKNMPLQEEFQHFLKRNKLN